MQKPVSALAIIGVLAGTLLLPAVAAADSQSIVDLTTPTPSASATPSDDPLEIATPTVTATPGELPVTGGASPYLAAFLALAAGAAILYLAIPSPKE